MYMADFLKSRKRLVTYSIIKSVAVSVPSEVVHTFVVSLKSLSVVTCGSGILLLEAGYPDFL